ncbi:MAG: hypothetical protein ACK40M_00355 [Flavobacteriales bacterium]
MPKVRIQQHELECRTGENLRELLVRFDLVPEAGSQWGTCKGAIGCGTCKLKVKGIIAAYEKEQGLVVKELNNEQIYSCKARVISDIEICG